MAQVRIVLTGGPINLPDAARVRSTDSLGSTVKVRFGGGYEHFVYTGRSCLLNGEEMATFDWSCRTKIAE